MEFVPSQLFFPHENIKQEKGRTRKENNKLNLNLAKADSELS